MSFVRGSNDSTNPKKFEDNETGAVRTGIMTGIVVSPSVIYK